VRLARAPALATATSIGATSSTIERPALGDVAFLAAFTVLILLAGHHPEALSLAQWARLRRCPRAPGKWYGDSQIA
jgi:hypothetical protein